MLKPKRKKSKIKVKHIAVANTAVVDGIFWAVVAATKLTYPTAEAEQEGLLAAKHVFEKEIHCIVSQAFRTGKKIGHYKADSKDTEAYVEPAVM